MPFGGKCSNKETQCCDKLHTVFDSTSALNNNVIVQSGINIVYTKDI